MLVLFMRLQQGIVHNEQDIPWTGGASLAKLNMDVGKAMPAYCGDAAKETVPDSNMKVCEFRKMMKRGHCTAR